MEVERSSECIRPAVHEDRCARLYSGSRQKSEFSKKPTVDEQLNENQALTDQKRLANSS
jgi:hypothetical protein